MQETILISLPVTQLQTLIIDCVNACLDVRADRTGQPETDQLLTVQQTAQFLTLAPATIYSMVCRGEIPSSKRGKRLYFSKQELTEWVKAGRNKTLSDHATEADAYLSTYKKGGK